MHNVLQDVDSRCSMSANHSFRMSILYLDCQIAAIHTFNVLA
jgi:hypothetical protein